MPKREKSLIDMRNPILPAKKELVFILILACSQLAAQTISDNPTTINQIRRNCFYFELLGNGVWYSVNYDRVFPVAEKLAVFGRIGLGEYHGDDIDQLNFNIIGASGILFGKWKHFLEAGVAYTFMTYYPDHLITITGGYRFLGKKGLVIRMIPMYIINTEKGDTFGNSLWIGVSLGYAF
jgi:hypothetical protein